MDAVTFAINEVKHSIPPQILALVFTPTVRQMLNHHEIHNPNQALDAAIRAKVIDSRVRQFADNAGAMMVELPLEDVPRQELNRFSFVYNIPKTLTQGRLITSALALSYGNNSNMGLSSTASNFHQNYGISCGHGPMLDAGASVAMSHSPIPNVQSANVSLIGENTVLVEDYAPLARRAWLRCLLSNDNEFTNIKPQTYAAFSRLVVLATKAFIYNTYYIELGAGYLTGGMELPEIKQIVDEYRDANDMFLEEYRERWVKTAALQDPRRKQRHIKMMTGGLG